MIKVSDSGNKNTDDRKGVGYAKGAVRNHFVKLFSCCFVKLIFSAEFHSVPFRSELRNWLFRGTRNASE
jgi:hypothetical protein